MVFVQDMLLGPIYKYLPLGTGKFWKIRQEVLDEVKKAIAHRRANPVDDDKVVDLMSAMMKIKDDETPLTDQDIIDQCLTFLFAGHDTTASTLSWVLYFLAKHPEELKKARAEVDRVLGPRSADEQISIGADKIHELEYCKAILFEAMRIRTPVVGVDRYPTRDTEIDGVKVYAGQNTAVGIGFFNIHRNPLYWPQPEKFIPERFVTGSAHHDPKRHPYSFIPFSAGERNCIGMKLAQNEAFLAIAHIVRRFDFSVNDANMIHATAPLYVPKNLVWQVRERQD
jgi:cytochrome P450 family 4